MSFDPISIATTTYSFVKGLFRYIRRWWTFRLPSSRVLGDIINEKTVVKLFLKDFFVPNNIMSNPKLISQEGRYSQSNPNIDKVWAEVEGEGMTEIFNLLGSLDKRANLKIVPMSQGFNDWEGSIIVLGAQAMKSQEFYNVMDCVGDGVDDHRIYNVDTNDTVIDPSSDEHHGYGVIVKALNNNVTSHGENVFLLGGFGVLGTEAAIYYFCHNIAKLGREFNKDYFSIVVKARASGGKETVRRVKDKVIRFSFSKRRTH